MTKYLDDPDCVGEPINFPIEEPAEEPDFVTLYNAVWNELMAHADPETAIVWLTAQDITDSTGYTKEAVQRAMRSMVAKDRLTVHENHGRLGTEYTIPSLRKGVTTTTKLEEQTKQAVPVDVTAPADALKAAQTVLDASDDFVGRLVSEYLVTRRALEQLVKSGR